MKHRRYKPLKSPESPHDIAEQLRWLSAHMLDVAVSIEYFGGFASWAEHGIELAGAATIAEDWADEIDKLSEPRAKK